MCVYRVYFNIFHTNINPSLRTILKPEINKSFNMGNIHIVGSCFVCIWLCLPFTVYCQVYVSPVHISLQQPVEGGNVTLICAATNFNPEVHTFTWRRIFPNSFLVDVTADDRVYISNATLISDVVNLYNQSLTISNLKKSDEGKYLCEITDSAGIVGNGEGSFTVNTTEEFPVCFPEGAAVVNEGDTMSCRTVIDERTPTVSDTHTPLARTDWTNSSLAGEELGSQLQKNITIQDDGVTFLCISFNPQHNNWTSLSCHIGPLTVNPLTSSTTINPYLSVGAIIGIICSAFILLTILIGILVIINVYKTRLKRNTTFNNQSSIQHIYANSILETKTSSSTDAEIHNYANVHPFTSHTVVARMEPPSPSVSSNRSPILMKTEHKQQTHTWSCIHKSRVNMMLTQNSNSKMSNSLFTQYQYHFGSGKTVWMHTCGE